MGYNFDPDFIYKPLKNCRFFQIFRISLKIFKGNFVKGIFILGVQLVSAVFQQMALAVNGDGNGYLSTYRNISRFVYPP